MPEAGYNASTMPRTERQFTERVIQALRTADFQVEREVRVRRSWCLDLLATKDNRKGIEVKLDRRGLLDDLVKAQKLVRLPDIDEMYVCGPKVFMSDDVRALAANSGVGLLALTDAGELEWLASSKRLEPARLTVNGAYIKPRGNMRFNEVRAGGKVLFNAAVFNSGDKVAVNVEVFMILAGPFVARFPSKARVRKPCLEKSGPIAWSAILECSVKKGTPPGSYSLMISATADNAPRDNTTAHYEVLPAR
jgi:hypothetical protein